MDISFRHYCILLISQILVFFIFLCVYRIMTFLEKSPKQKLSVQITFRSNGIAEIKKNAIQKFRKQPLYKDIKEKYICGK